MADTCTLYSLKSIMIEWFVFDSGPQWRCAIQDGCCGQTNDTIFTKMLSCNVTKDLFHPRCHHMKMTGYMEVRNVRVWAQFSSLHSRPDRMESCHQFAWSKTNGLRGCK